MRGHWLLFRLSTSEYWRSCRLSSTMRSTQRQQGQAAPAELASELADARQEAAKATSGSGGRQAAAKWPAQPGVG
jgi:hypothetical protein